MSGTEPTPSAPAKKTPVARKSGAKKAPATRTSPAAKKPSATSKAPAKATASSTELPVEVEPKPADGTAGPRPEQGSHEPVRPDPATSAESATSTDDVEPVEAPAPPARRGRAVPLVLVALALALAVAAGVLAWANHRQAQELAAGEEAMDVVPSRIEELLSYTPSTVASDITTEKQWLTGDFADELTARITDRVAPAAEEAEVTTEASVTAVGVDTQSRDRVELLLFVNVTTSTAKAEEPEVQGSRVRVVAQRVGDDWLISDLVPV